MGIIRERLACSHEPRVVACGHVEDRYGYLDVAGPAGEGVREAHGFLIWPLFLSYEEHEVAWRRQLDERPPKDAAILALNPSRIQMGEVRKPTQWHVWIVRRLMFP